jgi:ectoine hydroxylase-related dioxygenase (phytanoyl-CoA dioxygenase family)
MNSYGITESEQAASALDQAVEQVHRVGFAALRDVVPGEALAEARDRLDAVYARQVKEFGLEKLAAIQETDQARSPLTYDAWFFQLLTFQPVTELMGALLGSFHQLNLQNGIINRPDIVHHQTSWHRDLPYQSWVCSKPLAVNAMFCLDDFNVETGCTMVLPHSHRFEKFPSQEYVKAHETAAVAPAGSVIIFDAMLYHRAGENTSQRVRRGINHLYTIPLLKQQIALPRALDAAGIEPPAALRRLLGYDTEEPGSALEWRERRWARTSHGAPSAKA